MDELRDSLEIWLASVCGRSLDRVIGSFHVPAEPPGAAPSDNPLDLWLGFSGSPLQGIRCCGNGEYLCLLHEPPMPCDMAEYGRGVIRDISQAGPWAKVQGRELRSACSVSSGRYNERLGVKLVFGDEAVYLLNWGDELVACSVVDELPLEGETLIETKL